MYTLDLSTARLWLGGPGPALGLWLGSGALARLWLGGPGPALGLWPGSGSAAPLEVRVRAPGRTSPSRPRGRWNQEV
ncbi:hypothetical protein NDU88_000370 [Pleurodeles waltl]|uniref:Uncharacterized protein n=1 Tax=Pleurodeles waltl TaxID=8319 RepID=A0AAV7MGM5_PLEWA|nr:hypothetical protein NDU88_000370 [Pleurodeles waltl]